MNNFKQSLDRYLTTEPEDNFTPWCEAVYEAFDLTFFEANERWLFDYTECDKWLNKLFNKGKNPKEASEIIQRAHQLFINNRI